MILFKLSTRYIKKGQTKTVTTLLGIILATFLVTTVLLMVFSMLESMQESSEKMYGSWHVAFTGVDETQREAFINEFENELLGKSKLLGFVKNEENIGMHICVIGAEKNWYDMMNIALVSGELPDEAGEIIVSDKYYNSIINDNKADIEGGTLKLCDRYSEDGEYLNELTGYSDEQVLKYKEDFEYKIVGVYDDVTNKNVADMLYYNFYTYSNFNAGDDSRLYVKLENPDNAYTRAEGISYDSCFCNKELLSSMGISVLGENEANQLKI